MVRRTIAVGGGLLVLILLVFGFRGCLDARKERAFKDYVRDASARAQSEGRRATQLFELLARPSGAGPGGGPREPGSTRCTRESATLVDRARDLDPPDELERRQRYLVETLEFRRDGSRSSPSSLPAALGDRTSAAAARADRRRDAGLPRQRRDLQRPLRAAARRTRSRSRTSSAEPGEAPAAHLPARRRLARPDFVADQIARDPREAAAAATPGLHGNGLGTVSLGGRALTPGGRRHRAARRATRPSTSRS